MVETNNGDAGSEKISSHGDKSKELPPFLLVVGLLKPLASELLCIVLAEGVVSNCLEARVQ